MVFSSLAYTVQITEVLVLVGVLGADDGDGKILMANFLTRALFTLFPLFKAAANAVGAADF